MTFPTLRISGRTIAMSYLCIAVFVPSMIGVAVLREATAREEMDRETTRQLIAQTIARGIAQSAASTSAILSALASDPATSRALSGDGLDVVEMRLRRIMQAVGIEQIELRAPNGPSVLRVTQGDAAAGASPDQGSGVRFHHAVRSADFVLGEVVATVPITKLVDVDAYWQNVGRIAVNSRDGRVLAGPEAEGRSEILDVPEMAGATRVPAETGMSTAGPGTSVAFAVAGNLPILVTVTASIDRPQWPWWSLVLLDGLLLVVGWLVVANMTSTQAHRP